MNNQLLLVLLAVVAGAVLPLQAGLNVLIGKAAHQPIFAAFISFVIGSIGLLVYLLIARFDFSSVLKLEGVPPYAWISGLLGAFYVAMVIVLAPKLGTALTFSLVVAGQMLVSVVLDHYGLMHLPVKPINLYRVLGIALLIGGVLLIRRF